MWTTQANNLLRSVNTGIWSPIELLATKRSVNTDKTWQFCGSQFQHTVCRVWLCSWKWGLVEWVTATVVQSASAGRQKTRDPIRGSQVFQLPFLRQLRNQHSSLFSTRKSDLLRYFSRCLFLWSISAEPHLCSENRWQDVHCAIVLVG